MFQPVTIESDALRMEVWPQMGGKVSSIVDKADHYELLFSYPAEIPDRPLYDRPYADSWCVGWDECFPSVAPSKYSGYPYDGIASPDHGEIWSLPTTAVPTKNGITTVWHGLRFGYRLTRKLYLEDASIAAEYTLVNLAPFVFRFVWAQHALLSLKSPVEIALEPGSEWRFSHDATSHHADEPFAWPKLGSLDLSRPDLLPDARGWKVFSTAPVSSPAIMRYPSRGRSLRMEFASESGIGIHWGLWINTGGWNQYRHLALEPTTGRYDELDRCIRDGSAGAVEPMAKVEWSTRWTVGAE